MPHPDNKPPIASAPISMALPVRDMAPLVERAVPQWMTALAKLERQFELLLVDDGSGEEGKAKAEALAGRHKEIVLLRHETPKGFGAALRTALGVARHPLFFYSALDYPYQTTDLRKLLERMDDVDVISGFRAARRPPDWYRNVRFVTDILIRVLIGLPREPLSGWLGGKVHFYNRIMRTVFGTQLDDVESAYKLFRREVFERMVIQSDGPFVHTEIVAKANFMTLWMDEVPIGAQGGVPPEALVVPFKMSERWRDLRRVLFQPEFPAPKKTEPQETMV
jgi:glycosyltransferase involved in cell wall biosynthesis